MKSIRTTTAAALAVCLTAAPASAQPAASTVAAVTAVADRTLGPATAGPGPKPGCAVRVSRGEELLLSKAYGYADLERAVPFDPDTVSESGSVAKQMMAAEILLLVEDGKLSLDDDVRTYLPEMPRYAAPIRIYDLLHQLSGVREYSTIAALRGYPRFYRTVYDLNSAFALIARQTTLNFTPGTRFEYSNSNYVLLTLIVERVSGMSAAEFGRRRLFEPLGMTSTRWRDDARRLAPRRALAYRNAATGPELFMPTENTYGHGALLTTVSDLERWNRAIYDGRLTPFVARRLAEPGRLRNGETRAYASGVIVGDHRGRTVYRHGGVTAGYTAQLSWFPDSRLSIAMLCNGRVADLSALASQIADSALGLPSAPFDAARQASPSAQTGSPPAQTLYRADNGELLAIASGAGAAQLDLFTSHGLIGLPKADDATVTVPGLGRVELRRRPNGAVVLQIDDREPLRFQRVPQTRPAPVAPGRYVSPDLGAAYVLSRTADGLRLDLDDPEAPDPIGFRLQWLGGDHYRARIETRSGYIRDDMVVSFQRGRNGEPSFTMASVAGLQAVDGLTFARTRAQSARN